MRVCLVGDVVCNERLSVVRTSDYIRLGMARSKDVSSVDESYVHLALLIMDPYCKLRLHWQLMIDIGAGLFV